MGGDGRRTKTFPERDRPTLSGVSGQYSAIGTIKGTPHAELKSGIIAQNAITNNTRCFFAQLHYNQPVRKYNGRGMENQRCGLLVCTKGAEYEEWNEFGEGTAGCKGSGGNCMYV